MTLRHVLLRVCLGTMSGGGNKVSRGGMCSKISEDVDGLSGKELEALEKKLSAHSDELTEHEARFVKQLSLLLVKGGERATVGDAFRHFTAAF